MTNQKKLGLLNSWPTHDKSPSETFSNHMSSWYILLTDNSGNPHNRKLNSTAIYPPSNCLVARDSEERLSGWGTLLPRDHCYFPLRRSHCKCKPRKRSQPLGCSCQMTQRSKREGARVTIRQRSAMVVSPSIFIVHIDELRHEVNAVVFYLWKIHFVKKCLIWKTPLQGGTPPLWGARHYPIHHWNKPRFLMIYFIHCTINSPVSTFLWGLCRGWILRKREVLTICNYISHSYRLKGCTPGYNTCGK